MKGIKSYILKSILIASLAIGLIIPSESTFGQSVVAQKGGVPNYYYADYKFIDNWNDMWDIFSTMEALKKTDRSISSDMIEQMQADFDAIFPHLTKNYHTTYETCRYALQDLKGSQNTYTLSSFLGSQCYSTLMSNVNTINSTYRVRATATANPSQGSAPITVTFDARGSVDPSSETIPTDNFYRYYRDENGVDTMMGKGNVINYTFKEAGKFYVHLVVRSSNVDELGILDGEKDLTINVSPKAANIVVYANTRKMATNTVVKIGTSEGAKGVVFDGSATQPTGGRKILSHTWLITKGSTRVYSKSEDGTPGYINVPLTENGQYKISLTTKDNESNSVTETFTLNVSDPVSVIKQTPSIGTTSTTYTFDGSASYSLTSKLTSYLWEIFDSDGNKIATDQGKSYSRQFSKPGNYLIRLTVTDARGESNIEITNLYVESTTPTPQFTSTATKKREKPSEFTFDATPSSDIDVSNGVDSLEYRWSFSNSDSTVITKTEDNNKKITAQFNEIGTHKVTLTVTDQYGESASVTKTVDVKSVLRPEIIPKPNAITWGKTVTFETQLNTGVFTYVWDFGDNVTVDSQSAKTTEHTYASRGIYTVTLKVYNDNDSNSVSERMYIGETDYPIAAYKVKDNNGLYLQPTDACTGDDGNIVSAYPIDRYSNFTIDGTISVNTKGNQNGLVYAFIKDGVPHTQSSFTQSFSRVGCNKVELSVYDNNTSKQDKTTIWFKVNNAMPTLDNIVLSFPQYTNDSTIGFQTSTTTNQSIFDGTGSNVMTKVTAVNVKDPDGSISRLRFYYYNVDDPGRMLEFKDAYVTTPYAFFQVPRTAGDFRFGVILYDNDGGIIDSEDIIGSGPSIYFPDALDAEIPSVTLKTSLQSVEVGDTITYSIVSKVASNSEDFEANRTFYYDFTGDGIWDLTTKSNTATYTFTESFESGFIPRAAVEYRSHIGQGSGAKVVVKNGIKPSLLYNSYKNIVIFRDMSMGIFDLRQICFDTEQCSLGNAKYRRTHTYTGSIAGLTESTSTSITENQGFIQKYPSYGTHNISLYLRSKYGNEVSTGFNVTTSDNSKNGFITTGVNIISIPETTFNNGSMEIFLSRVMDNTIYLYLNHENGEKCYIDKDITKDSDSDGKADNDKDYFCNTLVKLTYDEPSYGTVGKIYFTNTQGEFSFKNFYVTFEGYILALDEEDLAIFQDINTLINGLPDSTSDNIRLKSELNSLRKSVAESNSITRSSTVVTISTMLNDGIFEMSKDQEELLKSVLSRLSDSSTISALATDQYTKSKQEILTMTASGYQTEMQSLFTEFESVEGNKDEQYNKLANILNEINKMNSDKAIDSSDYGYMVSELCNIADYYTIDTETCRQNNQTIDTESDSKDNSGSKLSTALKIVLIILVCGLVAMGGVVVFFAIKARIASRGGEDDEG